MSIGLISVAAEPWLRGVELVSGAPSDTHQTGHLHPLTSLLRFLSVTGGNERAKLFRFHRTSSLPMHDMKFISACRSQDDMPHRLTFLKVSISSRLISYASSSIRFPASLHRVTQLIPTRYGLGSS